MLQLIQIEFIIVSTGIFGSILKLFENPILNSFNAKSHPRFQAKNRKLRSFYISTKPYSTNLTEAFVVLVLQLILSHHILTNSSRSETKAAKPSEGQKMTKSIYPLFQKSRFFGENGQTLI